MNQFLLFFHFVDDSCWIKLWYHSIKKTKEEESREIIVSVNLVKVCLKSLRFLTLSRTLKSATRRKCATMEGKK